MQTIDDVSNQVWTAIETATKSLKDEREVSHVKTVCDIAIYCCQKTINERQDHLRARQSLFALSPLRAVAEFIRIGQAVNLLERSWQTAEALHRTKLGGAFESAALSASLAATLQPKDREWGETWLAHCLREIPMFQPATEDDGWIMVQLMLDGKDYASAFHAIGDHRKLIGEINAFLSRKNDAPGVSGKSLPGYGSLVTGPGHSKVVFGIGGSCTLVNGQLLVILK